MPSQPQITEYFTVLSDGSANSNGDGADVPANPLDRVMQFVQQRTEGMLRSYRSGMAQIESLIQTALTKMEEENHQIRIQMEEKLREAEVAIAESRGEVARLTEKIAELENVVHRQGHTERGQRDDVGEPVDEEGNRDTDGADAGSAGHQQQVLADGVTPELLQSMIHNHLREEDRYWRSSLMVTAGTTGRTDYRGWVQWLRSLGLYSLVEGAHTHYITGRGNLRLTYPAEIDMRRKLIEARKFCKENQLRCIHVEFLIPKRFVESKKVMMRFGRELKRDNVVTAYDVVMRESIPVLRTFKQTTGVKFWSLEELQNQGVGQEEGN